MYLAAPYWEWRLLRRQTHPHAAPFEPRGPRPVCVSVRYLHACGYRHPTQWAPHSFLNIPHPHPTIHPTPTPTTQPFTLYEPRPVPIWDQSRSGVRVGAGGGGGVWGRGGGGYLHATCMEDTSKILASERRSCVWKSRWPPWAQRP